MIKFTWPPSKPQRLRNTHMTPPPPSLAFSCRPVLYSPPSLLCLRRLTPLLPFSLKQCDLPRKSSCLKAYSVLQDLSWIQIVDTWVFSLYVVTETFGSRKQLDFVWTKAPGCQLIHCSPFSSRLFDPLSSRMGSNTHSIEFNLPELFFPEQQPAIKPMVISNNSLFVLCIYVFSFIS